MSRGDFPLYRLGNNPNEREEGYPSLTFVLALRGDRQVPIQIRKSENGGWREFGQKEIEQVKAILEKRFIPIDAMRVVMDARSMEIKCEEGDFLDD